MGTLDVHRLATLAKLKVAAVRTSASGSCNSFSYAGINESMASVGGKRSNAVVTEANFDAAVHRTLHDRSSTADTINDTTLLSKERSCSVNPPPRRRRGRRCCCRPWPLPSSPPRWLLLLLFITPSPSSSCLPPSSTSTPTSSSDDIEHSVNNTPKATQFSVVCNRTESG
eukprot:Pompholyxophrys_punicea_v1_NODE_614_length_1594_cov_2.565302.p2 type:complete len:170 gc:universal NODE_614_length_1594_cov_2.565302:530-1039(+)